MMQVVTTPAVNVARESSEAVARYEREIAHLRQELVMHDALCGRTGVRYGPMDEHEKVGVVATPVAAHCAAAYSARVIVGIVPDSRWRHGSRLRAW
jgi:hypothetical protein